MKICIYCSANADIDPDFFRMTEALGRWAAENAHSIVYGGVNQGLMECVAKAAHEGWCTGGRCHPYPCGEIGAYQSAGRRRDAL